MAAELQRTTEAVSAVENSFRLKLEAAESGDRQMQEKLDVLLEERADCHRESARREREARQLSRKVQRLQASVEEADAALQAQHVEVEAAQHKLQDRQREVNEKRRALEDVKVALGFDAGPPAHWASLQDARDLQVHRITDPQLMNALQQTLLCQNPDEWLGKGADVRDRGQPYNYIALREAWRVEHLLLWHKYCAEVSKMKSDLQMSALDVPRIEIRADLRNATSRLPGPTLREEVNEQFLLHGTVRDTVLPILRGRLQRALQFPCLFWPWVLLR